MTVGEFVDESVHMVHTGSGALYAMVREAGGHV